MPATTTTTRRPGDLTVVDRLEVHRRALTAHCYRMLGSAFEADDAVQETMVRAWRSFDRYEGRGPLEAWLFRIATNVCLNLLRGRGRRALPMDMGPASRPDVAVPTVPAEVAWVGPVPDSWVLDPADSVVERESLRLAFVTALQRLPPRHRAVLILRDVLRWSTHEVATLLATTDTSVKSTLQRARATMGAAGVLPGAALDPDAHALLEQYIDAFERYDVGALVELLHEDAVLSMPPFDLWLEGAGSIQRWWQREECRGSRLLVTGANGSPAVAQYRQTADGSHEAFAILVLETSHGRIAAMHAFIDPELFELFGVPLTL
jgi:RNA polymerase sigma-70 factor (ECF subfamily)